MVVYFASTVLCKAVSINCGAYTVICLVSIVIREAVRINCEAYTVLCFASTVLCEAVCINFEAYRVNCLTYRCIPETSDYYHTNLNHIRYLRTYELKWSTISYMVKNYILA
jgi:hypothetical protein